MIIYGSMLCPDCVRWRQELDERGVAYDYREITRDLKEMKAFLKLRDTDAAFDPIKAEGKIGIPCIVHEDGRLTFEWES